MKKYVFLLLIVLNVFFINNDSNVFASTNRIEDYLGGQKPRTLLSVLQAEEDYVNGDFIYQGAFLAIGPAFNPSMKGLDTGMTVVSEADLIKDILDRFQDGGLKYQYVINNIKNHMLITEEQAEKKIAEWVTKQTGEKHIKLGNKIYFMNMRTKNEYGNKISENNFKVHKFKVNDNFGQVDKKLDVEDTQSIDNFNYMNKTFAKKQWEQIDDNFREQRRQMEINWNKMNRFYNMNKALTNKQWEQMNDNYREQWSQMEANWNK